MVRKEKKLLRRTRINGRSWLAAYVIFLSHSFHYRCDIQYTAICNVQLTTSRRYCGCEGDNEHMGGGGWGFSNAMSTKILTQEHGTQNDPKKKFVETHLFGRLEKYEIIGLKG